MISITSSNIELIVACIGALGLISGLVEVLKKKLDLAEKTLFKKVPILKKIPAVSLVHYTLGVLVAGVHYISGLHTANYWIIFVQGLIAVGANVLVTYPALVKPISVFFSEANQLAIVKAAELESEVVSAPATRSDFTGVIG